MSEGVRAKRLNSGIRRGEQVRFYFDGKPLTAFKGETIATALMAAGHPVARTIDSQPLGVYCNIGICHSCLMTVNGVKSVRTCRTLVTDGCRVETQHFERTK